MTRTRNLAIVAWLNSMTIGDDGNQPATDPIAIFEDNILLDTHSSTITENDALVANGLSIISGNDTIINTDFIVAYEDEVQPATYPVSIPEDNTQSAVNSMVICEDETRPEDQTAAMSSMSISNSPSLSTPSNLLDSSPTHRSYSQSSGSQGSQNHTDITDSRDFTTAMHAATRQFEHETRGNASGTRSIGVAPASNFSYHTPEPPSFHVPPPEHGIFAPTFNGDFGDDLTAADLRVITQTDFTPTDNSAQWMYQMRRQAQKILPFLYLGPWEVLKNQMDFVRSQEISMLLVVRDTATAKAGIMNPKKYAEGLGILYDSIDVQNNQELISAFPHAIKLINNHLVNCYRQQVLAAGGNFVPGQSPFRMGKIFLFCESGNDRSAAIAVAYVLAMYKVSLLYSLQFVQAQRFCISIDESLKHLLSAYEDILKAQRDVRSSQRQVNCALKQPIHVSSPLLSERMGNMISQNMNSQPSTIAGTKRVRIMDEDEDMGDDEDRFRGRPAFQPFVQE